MLCINNYTQDYIDECRTRVDAQIAAYRKVRVQAAAGEQPLQAALDSFEPVFFNNMVLVLDALFVHRSRMMELKDGNPLNEVRMLCQSLMQNNGKMQVEKAIKLDPAKSVLKYRVGDEIKVSETDFIQLAQAFFAEMESKYLLSEPVTVEQ